MSARRRPATRRARLAAALALVPAVAAAQPVRCEAPPGRTVECAADTSRGVVLERQLGGAPCALGESWGWTARGVWVTADCRGEFGGAPRRHPDERRLVCDSDHGQLVRCPAETRNGLLLLADESATACRGAASWGIDGGSVWVTNGCRASFWSAPAGLGRWLSCASRPGERALCAVDASGGVAIEHQFGDATCFYGETWGVADGGLWVDGGCAAEFRVDGRLRGTSFWSVPSDLVCESRHGARELCPADTSRGVELVRESSPGACARGRGWGVTPRGIWVDRGCRAQFRLGG